MGFVIPSSRRKRYLSGADWIISTLDCMLKVVTSAGNMSQIVLLLDGEIDATVLQTRLNSFVRAFPVVGGRIVRDLNLAPYWSIPKASARDVSLNIVRLQSFSSLDDIHDRVEAAVNRPFRDDREHLVFHLIQGEGRACFIMTFDHRLFDGRGAETFLNLFRRYLTGDTTSSIDGGIRLTAPAGLSEWTEKFDAGRNLNRKIIALSTPPPDALPLPSDGNREFRFRIISFDAEESAKIYDNAGSAAGFLMEMPYLLAVTVQAVHELFQKEGMTAPHFVIPVSLDRRSGDAGEQELFFNHVSYLLFKIHAEETGDLKGLIQIIKQQMYDQVKSGMPSDIEAASMLTRIAPLSVLKRIFRIPFKGKIASFCFSHIGKSPYLFADFMGARVLALFHMPRVPVPPGLGFFFNYFNGRLTLVISYLDGLIREEDMRQFETRLRQKL
jgi:hypothetical protein